MTIVDAIAVLEMVLVRAGPSREYRQRTDAAISDLRLALELPHVRAELHRRPPTQPLRAEEE